MRYGLPAVVDNSSNGDPPAGAQSSSDTVSKKSTWAAVASLPVRATSAPSPEAVLHPSDRAKSPPSRLPSSSLGRAESQSPKLLQKESRRNPQGSHSTRHPLSREAARGLYERETISYDASSPNQFDALRRQTEAEAKAKPGGR